MSSTLEKTQQNLSPSVLIGKEKEFSQKFLHRLVEETIKNKRLANETALIYEDDGVPLRKTTYSTLNQNANRIARLILHINQLNPPKNRNFPVVICMKPSDDLVTVLFAIWKAGANYVPIDTNYPENKITYLLEDAKPFLVIHDDKHPNPQIFSSAKALKFSEVKTNSLSRNNENIRNEEMLTKGDASTMAFTLYTSGSTGMPKGVQLRHFTFYHRILWQLKTFPYGSNEKFCVFKTDLIFMDHIAELWCPLMTGKTVVVVPKAVVTNPEQFVTLLETYQIKRIVAVPTLIRNILMYLKMAENNKTKFLLSNLKFWYSTGEPLTRLLVNEFLEYFDYDKQVLINGYGCTEVCGDVSWFEIKSKDQMENLEKIPIGTPLPNTKIYILNKDNKILPEGEIGEICCAGVMIADGYINEKSNGAFTINPHDYNHPYSRLFKTGDFGYVKNGLLYFEGRHDTQIKIRGHRVDVLEVENSVNNLDYVSKSVILVYHATQIDQAVVDFVVLKDSVVKTPLEIEKDLKSHLPLYMVPQIFILKELPYMVNGKVDRQKLLEIYVETFTATRKQSEMKMDLKCVTQEKFPIAKEVFDLIGFCLGNDLRNKVTATSNFFDLGGNSINAVYTVKKLQEKGFHINLTDFINSPNLGTVLKKMSTRKRRITRVQAITSMNLKAVPLNDQEKTDCLNLIATSFFHKAELEQFLEGLKLEQYFEILEKMWINLMEDELSFMVKNETEELVGVCLNLDATDDIDLSAVDEGNALKTNIEFLQSIEEPILTKLQPIHGEIIHGVMYGASINLGAKEKIAIMGFMEEETINLAREKGYQGIFTTNTSPLTQQLAKGVIGYESLMTVQINQYEDKSGKRPFENAPDHYVVVAMFKDLIE